MNDMTITVETSAPATVIRIEPHVPWEASDFNWRLDPETKLGRLVADGALICSICGDHIAPHGSLGGCPGVQHWYRFDDSPYLEERLILESWMKVIRRTPAGVWLGDGCRERCWVSNTAERRQYYPSRELAFKSYLIRKSRQRQHLQHAMEKNDKILAILEQGLDHLDSLEGKHQRRPYSSFYQEWDW